MSIELYPGELTLAHFENHYLKRLPMVGFKNEIYLYYKPEHIKNYIDLSDDEIKSFETIAENPAFCGKSGNIGIKTFDKNAPICEVEFNNKEVLKTALKYEMKILGKGKEGRIGIYELKPSTNKKQNSTAPTILVAGIYIKEGFHTAKSRNKIYQIKLNIPNSRLEFEEYSNRKLLKNNYAHHGLFSINKKKNENNFQESNLLTSDNSQLNPRNTTSSHQ